MEPSELEKIDDAFDRPLLDPETRAAVVIMASSVKSADFARHALGIGHRSGMSRSTATEIGLQLGLFAGFPRCISVMGMIAGIWGPTSEAPRSLAPATLDEIRRRGFDLFRLIYAHHADRVLADLHRFDPDIVDLVIVGAYGRILSRPELSAATRELCAVAALTVSGDLKQLSSHARGAIHCGAEADRLFDVLGLIEPLTDPRHSVEAQAIVAKIAPRRS
jgi:4-carboxymuconolactone decarboxylase